MSTSTTTPDVPSGAVKENGVREEWGKTTNPRQNTKNKKDYRKDRAAPPSNKNLSTIKEKMKTRVGKGWGLCLGSKFGGGQLSQGILKRWVS